MEGSGSVSHAEARQMLRRAGYSKEEVEDMLRDLPDPIDRDRDAAALMKLGLTVDRLRDRMGGSP